MERIDLRSDTVTLPSRRDARGDGATRRSATTSMARTRRSRALQERVAGAARQGGRAVRAERHDGEPDRLKLLTRPGDDVIVGDEAHIVWHESGAAAANSGVQFTVVGRGGLFTAADLRAACKPPGHIIFPPTTLVAVENTHNRGGGVVFPQDEAEAICARRARARHGELSRRRAAVQRRGRHRTRRWPSWRRRSTSCRSRCRKGSAARSAA